jgi:hypothetical protein
LRILGVDIHRKVGYNIDRAEAESKPRKQTRRSKMSVQYHYMYVVRNAAGRIDSHWHTIEGRSQAKRIGGTCKRVLVECVVINGVVKYPQ